MIGEKKVSPTTKTKFQREFQQTNNTIFSLCVKYHQIRTHQTNEKKSKRKSYRKIWLNLFLLIVSDRAKWRTKWDFLLSANDFLLVNFFFYDKLLFTQTHISHQCDKSIHKAHLIFSDEDVWWEPNVCVFFCFIFCQLLCFRLILVDNFFVSRGTEHAHNFSWSSSFCCCFFFFFILFLQCVALRFACVCALFVSSAYTLRNLFSKIFVESSCLLCSLFCVRLAVCVCVYGRCTWSMCVWVYLYCVVLFYLWLARQCVRFAPNFSVFKVRRACICQFRYREFRVSHIDM